MFQLSIDLDATDDAKSAVDAVVADHVASPDLVGFASMLGYASQSTGREKAVTALNALIEKSPHRTVKAPALFSLGSMLTERGTAEEKSTGRKALERVVSEFDDVKPKRGAAYAERAKAYLFELDHLQVGMVAPNFESGFAADKILGDRDSLEIYLDIVNPVAMDMGRNGDRSGGVMRPAGEVIALSRQRGPLNGTDAAVRSPGITGSVTGANGYPVTPTKQESVQRLIGDAENAPSGSNDENERRLQAVLR